MGDALSVPFYSLLLETAYRRDVKLNDVNWSLVARSLLENSGYQTVFKPVERKTYDQSKIALRLRSSCGREKIYINSLSRGIDTTLLIFRRFFPASHKRSLLP